MKVAFDTNVLLDFLTDRKPFAEPAARLLSLVEANSLDGALCATSVTTVFYLARKATGLAAARKQTKLLLALLEVLAVNRSVLESAITSNFRDFEDAVVAEAAYQAGVDAIVTRNEKDFKHSRAPVYSPQTLIAALEASDL